MKTLYSLLLTALLGFGKLQAQAVLPGTYAIKLCDRPCSAGTARELGGGTLVLFADSTGYAASERAHGHTIPRRLFGPPPLPAPNACFKAIVPQRQVNGRELYFGIFPNSATSWYTSADSTKVTIYNSPDAHYTLRWATHRATKGGFAGVGVQADCCSDRYGAFGLFVAHRTGDADVRSCL